MKRKEINKVWIALLINMGIAILAFIGVLLEGGGRFTLSHDFNEQQIPFAMLMNDSIKAGNIGWNWFIDLGSDFVGSLSFYVLGSPFIWLSTLFSADAYVYCVGILFLLKYSLAGMTSYLYLERHTTKQWLAVLGSVLYAFSGFQCINLIFNHFHDVVALFPLLLWGMERLTEGKKKGLFAFAIAINCLLNYYFSIIEMVFVVLYFICKYGILGKETWKKIGSCIIEGIIGVGMAGILLIPSVKVLLDNPRVGIGNRLAFSNWFKMPFDYLLQLFRAFTFPAEAMGDKSCIDVGVWDSWSAYLPMVGLTLSIVYVVLQIKKKDWLKRCLILFSIFSIIPVLSCSFALLQDSNKRWYFMFTLLLALASVKVLENWLEKKLIIQRTAAIVGCVMLVSIIGILVWNSVKTQIIFKMSDYLFLSVLALLGVLLVFLATFIMHKEKYITIYFMIGIAVFSIITTSYSLYEYRKGAQESSCEYEDKIEAYRTLNYELDGYRIYTSNNEITMAGGMSGTGSFISTVSGSVFRFYNALGENRMVNSPYGPEGTDLLVSARYFVTNEERDDLTLVRKSEVNNTIAYLYEYKNTLPIGYLYNTYILKQDFLTIPTEQRAKAMLYTLVVDDSKQMIGLKQLTATEVMQSIESAKPEDLLKKHTEVATNIVISNNQYSCNIDTNEKGYAFFSIPNDCGWKVKVNGEVKEIIDINGLMAVETNIGNNEIVLAYDNSFLLYGAATSTLFFLIYLGYIFYEKRRVNHKA